MPRSLSTAESNLGGMPIRAQSKRTESVILTGHADADTLLAPLTPIAWDDATSKYIVYEENTRIVGFIWPDEQTQFDSEDTHVTIMVEGEISDYADIPKMGVGASAFYRDFQLSNLRQKNIYVKGVSGFYGDPVSAA